MPTLNRLMTKAQAAEILGVGIRTIERMIAGQEIPAVWIRRCRRIPESAVRALMASQERPPSQEPTEAAQPVTPPADPFRRVTCPACGNSGALLASAVGAFGWLRCSACGHRHRL